MKSSLLALSAAMLLVGCNQTAPVTSAPGTATPAGGTAPAGRPDSAAAASTAPAADAVAAAAKPATPKLAAAETIKISFSFKPSPDSEDPSHPRTSAHLLLAGTRPQDIDLGKFASKPDVVDAAKAKQAGFPAGMLLGFRSYNAAAGTSEDLAVLFAEGRYLRIVQRRVNETATEPGEFKTSREVTLPPNTRLVATPMVKK